VLSSDRRVLVLQGSRETPDYFAIRDNFTLRKLDTEGREIASSLAYDLRRSSAFQLLEVRLTMRGRSRSRRRQRLHRMFDRTAVAGGRRGEWR
jgi:hypothetical protein